MGRAGCDIIARVAPLRFRIPMANHLTGSAPSAPRQALLCPSCGARRPCPLRAVAWCARDGWPRCCGEVMVLTADEPLGAENDPAGGSVSAGGEHAPSG